MDLFTYLMAKNGNNTSVHGDLFSYLLGKGQSQTQTISGVTIYIPDAKKLVSFMMTKESTQDGEPTPDNPQEVKTVKGSVDVKVVGKNLFDKNNANVLNAYIDTNGNILSATNGKSLYINCKSNTTYTVSRISGTRFRIVDTNVLPEIGIKGNNFVGVDTSTSLTITTSNNAKYLCVNYFNRNTDGDTEQEILDSIQIEEGTTATTYEPYQESIVTIPLNNNEIVGIGDYKDELKVDKSGNVFINKKTGKVVLDGSEDWKVSNNGNFYNWPSNIFPTTGSPYITPSAFSNYYIATTYNNINNAVVDYGFGFGSTAHRIDIRNKDITTLKDWKTWLSTHNTEVYYVLETPETIDLQTTVDLKLFKGVNNVSNSEDGYMTIEYH